MTIITTIRDGVAPNPDTGLGGANEGHILGPHNDLLEGITGGVVDLEGGHCQVIATDPLSMSVQVSDGIVYVPNTDYDETVATSPKFYRVVIHNEDPISVPSNNTGDFIMYAIDVTIDKNVTPNEYASNVATLNLNAGTNIALPTLADNSYRLGAIELPDGTTQIISDLLGDTRTQIKLKNEIIDEVLTNKTFVNATLNSPLLETPKIQTSINDANGNEVIKLPPTSSAVNEFTDRNAATGGSPVRTTSGNNTNINHLLDAKGTGLVIPKLAVKQGELINGKISVVEASNNITVSLKTIQGNTPSADDPIYVRIGDTVRSITSALSVTKNAGTNWCNAGSAELATKEIDYFVYLGYNATDGVVIGFSRIPFATSYGDFSATTTNEKYAAISTITTAASTDYYELVGRFAATLSAGAGYTWSVPTFTATNLIQRPIHETRWLSFAPTLTGGTGGSAVGSVYQVVGSNVTLQIKQIGNNSNATTKSFVGPFALVSGTAQFSAAIINITDNSLNLSTLGHLEMTDGSSTISAYKAFYETVWTASGACNLYIPNLTYRIN